MVYIYTYINGVYIHINVATMDFDYGMLYSQRTEDAEDPTAKELFGSMGPGLSKTPKHGEDQRWLQWPFQELTRWFISPMTL